jgi:hypothetical protein
LRTVMGRLVSDAVFDPKSIHSKGLRVNPDQGLIRQVRVDTMVRARQDLTRREEPKGGSDERRAMKVHGMFDMDQVRF